MYVNCTNCSLPNLSGRFNDYFRKIRGGFFFSKTFAVVSERFTVVSERFIVVSGRFIVFFFRKIHCCFMKIHCCFREIHCCYKRIRCCFRKIHCCFRKIYNCFRNIVVVWGRFTVVWGRFIVVSGRFIAGIKNNEFKNMVLLSQQLLKSKRKEQLFSLWCGKYFVANTAEHFCERVTDGIPAKPFLFQRESQIRKRCGLSPLPWLQN